MKPTVKEEWITGYWTHHETPTSHEFEFHRPLLPVVIAMSLAFIFMIISILTEIC